MTRSWVAVLAVAGLFLLTGWALHRGDGLTRTELQHPGGLAVRWEGVWDVPATGLYDLRLDTDGPASWVIDGYHAHQVDAASDRGAIRTVFLTRGFHRIEVEHPRETAAPRLIAAAAPTGSPPASIDAGTLKRGLPRNPRLRRATVALHQALAWLLAIAVVIAVRRTVPAAVGAWTRWRARVARPTPSWFGKAFAWIALALILGYGAVLRLDAITDRFGPVSSPAWLAAVQTRTVAPPDAVRPEGFSLPASPLVPHADGVPTRYLSDPYTYLEAARGMQSFYQAHFREPVFPYATRIFLALLDDQDVAVSFTSAAFSVLAIWFTYLLGAAVWSRPVGLIAALGLAIEFDAVALASAGWRDDAFVAAVAGCAVLLQRYWRAAGDAEARAVRLGSWSIDRVYVVAGVLGVIGGLSVLVRLFAVSFVVAGIVLLPLVVRTTWRRRLTMAGLAMGIMVVVAAPYFINTWRVFGDPFLTFSVHGNVYRIAEGQQESSQGTVAYILGKASARPFDMADTVARGLTVYPFATKWQGFGFWWPRLGDWGAAAAIVGLLVLAASARGRVMLFVALMSVVPFAFTWKVDPNWRFTAHAYPFLLVAAGVGVSAVARCLRVLLVPGRKGATTPAARWRSLLIPGVFIALIAGAGTWFIARTLPRAQFVETLRVGEAATVTAGSRDAAFFRHGWTGPFGEGNVRMRMTRDEGEVVIPIPADGDYALTVRMDPFPRPLAGVPGTMPIVEVALNGATIAAIPLQWNPGRVGVYDVLLPRALVRSGDNRLRMRITPTVPLAGAADGAEGGLVHGSAVGVWYVRVRPR
jgi:hypothetical protein